MMSVIFFQRQESVTCVTYRTGMLERVTARQNVAPPARGGGAAGLKAGIASLTLDCFVLPLLPAYDCAVLFGETD